MNIKLQELLKEHLALFERINEIEFDIEMAAEEVISALKAGNKILICGNGGSAADAQHLAAELIGRFEKERDALPAIALSTDTSILTAVGNDYGYETIFSRQVAGLGQTGDLLVGISTSGNSGNVIRAVETAKECGMRTIGLVGGNGGKLKEAVAIPVVVPHNRTARIQEVHLFIYHYWALRVETELFKF